MYLYVLYTLIYSYSYIYVYYTYICLHIYIYISQTEKVYFKVFSLLHSSDIYK